MNEHLALWVYDEDHPDKGLPKVQKFDTPTRKWFEKYPDSIETLGQCPNCRLFYRTGHPHKCEEVKE